MSASQPAPAAADWDPGHVTLQVQMDLGAAPISLDELQALKAGFIFELPADASSPVTARINGVAIGQGELIRIGDRIGVRLTEVNPHAH